MCFEELRAILFLGHPYTLRDLTRAEQHHREWELCNRISSRGITTYQFRNLLVYYSFDKPCRLRAWSPCIAECIPGGNVKSSEKFQIQCAGFFQRNYLHCFIFMLFVRVKSNISICSKCFPSVCGDVSKHSTNISVTFTTDTRTDNYAHVTSSIPLRRKTYIHFPAIIVSLSVYIFVFRLQMYPKRIGPLYANIAFLADTPTRTEMIPMEEKLNKWILLDYLYS